jgi:hypothetical protein
MNLDSLFDSAAPGGIPPSGRMRAVEITKDHEVHVIETLIPVLGEGETLVRPAASAAPTSIFFATAFREPTIQ